MLSLPLQGDPKSFLSLTILAHQSVRLPFAAVPSEHSSQATGKYLAISLSAVEEVDASCERCVDCRIDLPGG